MVLAATMTPAPILKAPVVSSTMRDPSARPVSLEISPVGAKHINLTRQRRALEEGEREGEGKGERGGMRGEDLCMFVCMCVHGGGSAQAWGWTTASHSSLSAVAVRRAWACLQAETKARPNLRGRTCRTGPPSAPDARAWEGRTASAGAPRSAHRVEGRLPSDL
jgi:hypothetical protein